MIMKTTTSALRSGTAALALSIAALTSATFAQTTATTVPVGFMTVTIPAAASGTLPSNTTFSVPLYNTPDFAAAVATVDSTTQFTLTGASWVASQFANAAAPRFVRVKSSATASHVGKFFLVSDNTATGQLTVILPAGTTDVATAVGVADACEVVPGNTLATLFGPNSAGATGVFAAGTFFQTGATSPVADNLVVWNGANWDTYYNNNTNWKKSGNLTNQNNTVIYPDEGIFVIRRATAALTLTLMGTVPSTSEQTNLGGAGSTFIANRFPVDVSFINSGIQSTAGWVTGASAAAADTVFLWNGSNWDTYYHNGTNWKKSGNLANQNATLIPAGTALFIVKTSAASTLTQALPYTP